jgi:hypothetical protein
MLSYIRISHHLTICSCLNDPYPPLDPQKEDGHHRQTPISSSFISSASQHHIQQRHNPHCGKYATPLDEPPSLEFTTHGFRQQGWLDEPTSNNPLGSWTGFQLVGTAMHDCEAYSLALVFPHPSTNLTKTTSLPRFAISFSSFLLLVNLLHFGVLGLLRRTDGMGTSDMIWGMA